MRYSRGELTSSEAAPDPGLESVNVAVGISIGGQLKLRRIEALDKFNLLASIEVGIFTAYQRSGPRRLPWISITARHLVFA